MEEIVQQFVDNPNVSFLKKQTKRNLIAIGEYYSIDVDSSQLKQELLRELVEALIDEEILPPEAIKAISISLNRLEIEVRLAEIKARELEVNVRRIEIEAEFKAREKEAEFKLWQEEAVLKAKEEEIKITEETRVKIAELELKKAEVEVKAADKKPIVREEQLDISKYVKLLPQFSEQEPEIFFLQWEKLTRQ